MKILQVNFSDISGGAARAAHRIHTGLLGQGVDSQMLVQKKESNEPEIITPYSSKIKKGISILRPYVNSAIQRLQYTENDILHSSNLIASGLHKIINASDADIVHLHWINGEMISIKEVAKIKKPIVWTLHDMWTFSGSEHYDDLNNPERYIEGYTKDNRLEDYSGLDIDRWVWERKKKYWENVDFNFVTPSSWLAGCLKKSKLFGGQEAEVISYGLETSIFRPTNKSIAREKLGLPKDKKIVLYGAIGAETDPRKGYQKLIEARKYLKKNYELSNLLFVVFGGTKKKEKKELGVTTKYLGRINNDKKLALIYSSADVMVVPSLQDNLPNTAVEATACGTPVVAFNIGGLPDIVDHKENGYLAEAYNPKDLASGISWVLEDEERLKRLSENARDKALDTYAPDKVAQQYIEYYKEI